VIWLGRSTALRYSFAAAVGKRLYSERMTSTSKTAIIEHHRSVQWSEKEYINLLNTVQQNQAIIHAALVDNFSETTETFSDYCELLTSNQQMLDAYNMMGAV
jgi:hypothetical protein